MRGFFWTLYKVFPEVSELRQTMRAEGRTEPEITAATEQMVRHHLEPHVPPMHTWPEHLVLAKCAYCDGTGLVIHRNVVDRNGVLIDQGNPCRCPKGDKFLPQTPKQADHRQAGKTPKPDFKQFGKR